MSAVSPRVLVRRVDDLAKAVNEALDFIGYDFAGKKVWVKPNLLGPHPPERSVTTAPELVRYVVRALRTRRTKEIWVADNPAGGLQRHIAEYLEPTGVVQASEGCFRSISETPVTLRLQSRFIPEIVVSRIITEADVILNLPVFKTHALTILTGAVKNLFGIIPGGQKSALHMLARSGDDFGELLVDIYQAIPIPVLTIMDALRGMDGLNGPSGGRVLSLGRIISSPDPAALDLVMAKLVGADPQRIPTVRIAAQRGLGPAHLNEIDLAGDWEPIRGFRLPPTRLATSLTGISSLLAYPLLRRWPLLKAHRCIRCHRCADNCPVAAIKMTPFPQITRSRCILCYCCAELCPVRAMKVPGQFQAIVQNLFHR